MSSIARRFQLGLRPVGLAGLAMGITAWLLGSAFAGSAAADALFGQPLPFEIAPYDENGPPIGIAASDLNHDGIPDLVVPNIGSQTVSVLLGDGDGTFQPRTDYELAGFATAVVVADLNSDGHEDVAVTSLLLTGGADVELLLGRGDGTLQGATASFLGDGAQSIALAAGDLNSDGRPDLVTVNYGSPTSTVLLGNGDGTFQLSALNYSGSNLGIALGDVNRDGKLDLVAASYGGFPPNGLSVLLGNGDGTFQDRHEYPLNGYGFSSIVIADLNADGNPDVVTQQGQYLSIHLGDGSGAFPTYSLVPTLTTDAYTNIFWSSPDRLAVGDLSQDGIPDIATAIVAGGVQVFLGNGDGTFASDQVYGVQRTHGLALADLNRDHNLDLVSVGEVMLNIGPAAPPTVTMEFDPETLNLSSNRKWVTVTLEVSEPYSASDVNGSSLRLNNTVPPAAGPMSFDGRSLTVKFDWNAVKATLTPADEVTVTLDGNVAGAPFHASKVIRVLDHGSKRTLALRPAWSASGAPVLHYQLEHAAAATLEVFNVQGQRLESRLLTGGSIGWNTAPLQSHPAGVYMARITQNGRSETARVVVIH